MVRDGYKMTELGEIPVEWDVFNCETLFKLTSGFAKTKKEIDAEREMGRIPVYGGNGITGYTHNPLITHKTIIIGRVGEYCGTVHLTLNPCWVTDNALYIKDYNQDIDIIYLFYLLNHLNLSQLKNQTGQPLISQKPIYDLIVAIPPFPEQQKIASILSSVDENIEETEALIEKYQHVKKGLVSDLLTKGIDEEGCVRSEQTHDFKDSVLGRVPVEWDVIDYVSFGQVIDGDRGKHYPNGSELRDTGYCLFLNAKNVTKNGFRFSECQFISAKKDKELNKGKMVIGDVVLTTRGTLGNISYYTDEVPFENIRINSGMVILRNISSTVTNTYQYLALRSWICKSQIENLSFGSAQLQLTVKGISTLKIPIPPLPEQQRIAEILTSADQRIEKEEAYRDKLLQMKKGLMQDLLTGRVRVTV